MKYSYDKLNKNYNHKSVVEDKNVWLNRPFWLK